MKNSIIFIFMIFVFFYQLNSVVIIVPGEVSKGLVNLKPGGLFYKEIEQTVNRNHKIDYFEWYQNQETGILFNERVNGGLKLAQKILEYVKQKEWEINIIAYRFGCDVVFLASIFLSTDFKQENLNNLPIRFSANFDQREFSSSYPYLFSRNNRPISSVDLNKLKNSCVEYMSGGFGKICNKVMYGKPWIKDFFALNYPLDFIDTFPNNNFFNNIFNFYSPSDGGQFKEFNFATNIEVNIEDSIKKDNTKFPKKGNHLSSESYEYEKQITSGFLANWLLHIPMYISLLGEKNKNYRLTIFTDGSEPLLKKVN